MVKPSSPTPSHLRVFTLSYVDQIKPISPPLQRPIVMFYPPSHKTQPLDMSHLKASLSDALSVFYPLAGRVHQSTITCNDDGIPVFEARVKSPISSLMYSSLKPNLLWKLFPPRESLGIVENQPIRDLIHLTIQISLFSCGGVAIAWYDIHKIFDGISATNFFKYWACISSGSHDEAKNFMPNFDMTATVFPTVPNAKPLSYVGMEKKAHAFKSFLFRDSKINELKIKAATQEVCNPTNFQAVIGFIWEQVVVSKKNIVPLESNEEMTALSIVVDMRSRIDPPLPYGSIGNLITPTITLAREGAGLRGFVTEIHDAMRRKHNDIKGYTRENGGKAVRESYEKLFATLLKLKDRVYKVTSWCKLGFYDLDFGFGKPVWIIPTDGKTKGYQHTNMIILNNYNDSRGHGIEAWLVLEEKELQNLESNEEFLAFASPVF